MAEGKTTIRTKRVYDAKEETDGLRILVDKFWPRGVKKDSLQYDLWLKTVSPSDALRKMFHEDPEKHWDAFAEQYAIELRQSKDFKDLAEQIKGMHPDNVTLLYAFKNAEKNHAIVLKSVLERCINNTDDSKQN